MKNIIEILRDIGIEIPADKQTDFNKAVAENYKTIAEFEKRTGRLEAERDALRERAETAETTLKGFDGVDPAKLNDEIATWKKKAEDAETEFKNKIEAREKEEALSKALEEYEFSSVAAKTAVLTELRNSVAFKDGKLYGVSDVLKDIQARDASAFVEKGVAESRAKFTTSTTKNAVIGAGKSLADIMAIKDRTERRAEIAKHLHSFNGGNN